MKKWLFNLGMFLIRKSGFVRKIETRVRTFPKPDMVWVLEAMVQEGWRSSIVELWKDKCTAIFHREEH